MGAVEKGRHMMMISYNLHGMTLPRYDSDEYDDLENYFEMLTDSFVYARNVSIWMCSFYDCYSVGSKNIDNAVQYEMFKRDMPLKNYDDKPRVGVFFVYFDYNESKRDDVWFMCKLMHEMFKIEVDVVLKKVLKLKTFGYSTRIGITGVYPKGNTVSLEYADLMDCMHFSPKSVSRELFHRLCVACGSDLTLD